MRSSVTMKPARVRRFEDPGTFRRAVHAFLARREAENCLPLGILAQLGAGEYADRRPLFAAAFEGHRVVAAGPRARGLRVWEVDGEPVSLAGYGGPTPTGIRVGPVYTPEALRGRGYATACVGALTAELLRWRERCVLFTDAREPVPNHVYAKLGYEPVGRSGRYLLMDEVEPTA